MKLLIIFIALNLLNVILQTFKSIATIKYGKVMASIVNAVAYGLYTVVIIYTMCELPLWAKALIVAGTNFIGVFVVKLIEEKREKEKLWKLEANFDATDREAAISEFENSNIPFNYIPVGDTVIFNLFCYNKEQTEKARAIIKAHNGRVFVSESKIVL